MENRRQDAGINEDTIQCCADCKRLCEEAPSYDQPYPEIWCGAGHWEGIEDFNDLYLPTNCCDFNLKAG